MVKTFLSRQECDLQPVAERSIYILMRNLIIALALIAVFIHPAHAQKTGREMGIAAVVNQDAVSYDDLAGRLRLIIASSGLPDNAETRARLTPQIMDSLIDEQLMSQEAKRQNINITEAEISQGFAQLAQNNKMKPDQFQQAIKNSGIDVNTMRTQIRAQMGWSKVIQKVMRPQISITDADIDEYIARLERSKGKTEYLVAEIFLPVDAAAKDGNVRGLAAKLVSEIRANKAPFFKVAQQFSKAPGADQGGDRGWVGQGALQNELDAAIKTMKKNDVSDPIRTEGGYHILLLRDTRQITAENIPPREQVMSILGVQRLERMQRRYLMDLRSAAFIENRVGS